MVTRDRSRGVADDAPVLNGAASLVAVPIVRGRKSGDISRADFDRAHAPLEASTAATGIEHEIAVLSELGIVVSEAGESEEGTGEARP